MKLPTLIKTEILFLFIGLISTGIFSIPVFYHEQMTSEQINYIYHDSFLSTLLHIGIIIGVFLNLFLSLINWFVYKLKFWILKTISIFLMPVAWILLGVHY